MIALACCGVLLAAGVVFEQWSRWRAPRAFPPIGQLVEVAGKRTHLHCTGAGSPTVILEAGGGSPSAVWQVVQPDIAAVTRVCSYDRAGYAWSDRRRGARDAVHIADELHAVLRAASVPAPYIMVGHSMGGPLITVFTHRYPDDVAGLVFVDPSLPEQLAWDDSDGSGIKQTALIMLFRAAAGTGVLRLLQHGIDRPGVPPAVTNVLRAFGSRNIATTFREMDRFDQTLAQARALESFGDRPTIVLSAGTLPEELLSGPDGDRNRARNDRWIAGHARQASRSSNGEHRVVPGSGHLIQWDDPQAVLSAVSDVLARVRRNASPSNITVR